MNRARRVARPMTSGRTPVAAGSRVPVCPMRRSRSTRRRRATTSCDVGPAGLSMTNRPSIDGGLDLLDKHLLQRVDRARHGATGRVLVTAAAEFLGDPPDVNVALGAHADPVFLAFDLLEEDHRQ